jgi:hypothetical protein
MLSRCFDLDYINLFQGSKITFIYIFKTLADFEGTLLAEGTACIYSKDMEIQA